MTVALVLVTLLAVAALAACLYLWASLSRLRRFARMLGDETQRPAVLDSGPSAVADIASAFNRELGRLQAALQASTEERGRLSAAVATSSDGIVALRTDRTIALVNPAARSLLRPAMIEPDMQLARAVRDHEIITAVEKAIEQETASTVSVDYGAERRQLRVNINPLPAHGDWVALLVIQDMSDIRRIERTRREFVSNVSHELRTPLASIRAAVETLEDAALEDEQAARSFLSSIRDEVDRMTHMVEELLELSRIESGALPLVIRPIALRPVLEAALERIEGQAGRKELVLDNRAPIGAPLALGDPVRLEQVVVNLLQNAVKFTRRGGTIRLDVKPRDSRLIVSVADTGTGISRADLPHIFERFYKADRARSTDGTGLGLAIVKHTVQAHGGEVWAESEPDKGSVFSFSLPQAEAPSSSKSLLA
ncbi:MAG: ATP-binding protein [Dehalococcoidia bacterium]